MKFCARIILTFVVMCIGFLFLGLSTENGKMITDVSSDVTLIEEHIHSVQLVYPDLAAAVSIVSVNGAGTWTPGADTQVIPINTITALYDIHFVSIATISANANCQLDLYQGADGAGTKIASLTFARNDAFQRSFPLPITTPVLAANRRVYAKLADSDDAGITVTFKVWYHTY